jgi:hypothetical protein
LKAANTPKSGFHQNPLQCILSMKNKEMNEHPVCDPGRASDMRYYGEILFNAVILHLRDLLQTMSHFLVEILKYIRQQVEGLRIHVLR